MKLKPIQCTELGFVLSEMNVIGLALMPIARMNFVRSQRWPSCLRYTLNVMEPFSNVKAQ
jgi:hypothetical protein